MSDKQSKTMLVQIPPYSFMESMGIYSQILTFGNLEELKSHLKELEQNDDESSDAGSPDGSDRDTASGT